MNQADVEKYAFLYFCGKEDRDILSGKKIMTFEDFERLEYLTDLLGLEKYRVQIWNTFFKQFEEQFEESFEELCHSGTSKEASEGILRRENWRKEFIEQAPDRLSKRQLKALL